MQKQLTLDEGANRLGEFSLTDRRFSKISAFMANTLFDENYGGEQGNCHVAVARPTPTPTRATGLPGRK